MNYPRIRISHFVTLLFSFILLLVWHAASIAEGQELYRFQAMWPGLAQPWYFDQPKGVAVDISDNIYVTDQGNNCIRKLTAQGVVVAQWGTPGSGNGQLDGPTGIALDGSDNIYVADAGNHRIQKFSSSGLYVTQWGTGGSGNSQFSEPAGVAADETGSVYVVDSGNNRIQKFSSAGDYVLQWGSAGNEPGKFDHPTGIVVYDSSTVYVADSGNSRIQKFSSSGDYLGSWGTEGTGDGQFNYPTGISLDASGTISVTDAELNRVQRFTSTGSYLDQWGSTGSGSGQFSNPAGIVIDSSGTVYVADAGNNRVQKFTSGTSSAVSWGGCGTAAGRFTAPSGIARFANTIYVADSRNNRIQMFSPTGDFLAAWGTAGSGPGQFNNPQGISVCSSGNIYVADTDNHRIQKFSANGDFILQWGTQGSDNSQFIFPQDVFVDARDTVYVADTGNNRIQKFSSTGTYASQWGNAGSENGQFSSPASVAVDEGGSVYVADTSNSRIQKFLRDGTHLATWNSPGPEGDEFRSPRGIALDANGNVYVTETDNHRIQKLTPEGMLIASWGSAGSGKGQLHHPGDTAVDGDGSTAFVTDTGNHRVQVFVRISSPGSPSSGVRYYFPHVAVSSAWQTEVAIINTDPDRSLNGSLHPYDSSGTEVAEPLPVTVPARGRLQIDVGGTFTDAVSIRYLVLETDTFLAAGYTKFSQQGIERAAIPAVSETNSGDIWLSHIASSEYWWTGLALVNTTDTTRELSIEFNNGAIRSVALGANEHASFTIESFFDGAPQPSIHTAVIRDAEGIVGLELFGSTTQLSGILLTDKTSTALYYPHVASDATWWTGIVAFNAFSLGPAVLDIQPYAADGSALGPISQELTVYGRLVGETTGLGIPAEAAWFSITVPSGALSGFELFGTRDNSVTDGFSSIGIDRYEGVFAKIEKDGWTGIALVNTEDVPGMVTLTGYDHEGTAVATTMTELAAHQKIVGTVETLFSGNDVSTATYVGYSSNCRIAGFQLNGSGDGTMMDGLPGM